MGGGDFSADPEKLSLPPMASVNERQAWCPLSYQRPLMGSARRGQRCARRPHFPPLLLYAHEGHDIPLLCVLGQFTSCNPFSASLVSYAAIHLDAHACAVAALRFLRSHAPQPAHGAHLLRLSTMHLTQDKLVGARLHKPWDLGSTRTYEVLNKELRPI